MSALYWLTDEQRARLRPYSLRTMASLELTTDSGAGRLHAISRFAPRICRYNAKFRMSRMSPLLRQSRDKAC